MTSASRVTSMYEKGRAVGAAMAEAGLSKQRFARLLAARGPAREETLERTVRLMACKGRGLDMTDLARTVLWPADSRPVACAYYPQPDHGKPEEPQDA